MVEEFNNICLFRQQYPGVRGSGISVSDPILNSVKKDLQYFKSQLVEEFQDYKGVHFEFEESKGQTYFPSILHIAILPPKQSVSSGIYAVICFDILGRGAVAGCAESITNPQGLNTVIRKRPNVSLPIDVDGLRPTTKYNNVFCNPKEFYADLRSDTELIAHLRGSLDLALYNIGLIDAQELNVGHIVISGHKDLDFNPKNLQEAKEKIARQITARRGQKKFRNALLKAYNFKCSVTGCDVESVLEAAHIIPYQGRETNHVQNGILLRSDIHLLFDLGLLTVEADTYKIKVHVDLRNTQYFNYSDQKINLPKLVVNRPHKDAMKYHNSQAFKHS